MAGQIHIGTSGWQYDHWIGPFYPEDLPKKEWLHFYCQRLDTVEINNSFYQQPNDSTIDQWREGTPKDFVFAYKANRYITHMKRLKDPDEPLDKLFAKADLLKRKLGVVLFQCPPNWKFNRQRLETFLKALPRRRKVRFTIEFRDGDWFREETFELLSKYGVAFCIYELAGTISPKELTTDFTYVRLHGPGGAYQGRYGGQKLSGWAGAFNTWADQGKDVYCYFDNDEKGYATMDAMQMKEMLGG